MESASIVLTPKDGYILVDCADLGIHTAGHTIKEALGSFCENFQFSAEVYTNGNERVLSRDALDLAEKLKPFVSFDGTSRPFDYTWGGCTTTSSRISRQKTLKNSSAKIETISFAEEAPPPAEGALSISGCGLS